MSAEGTKDDSNRHKAVFLSEGWLLSFHVTCGGKGLVGQLFSGTQPWMFLSHTRPLHCSTNSGPADKKPGNTKPLLSWVWVPKVPPRSTEDGKYLELWVSVRGSPVETETHRAEAERKADKLRRESFTTARLRPRQDRANPAERMPRSGQAQHEGKERASLGASP